MLSKSYGRGYNLLSTGVYIESLGRFSVVVWGQKIGGGTDKKAEGIDGYWWALSGVVNGCG